MSSSPMLIDKFETGSGGFVWKNVLPNQLFSQLKLHVYAAFDMVIGERVGPVLNL